MIKVKYRTVIIIIIIIIIMIIAIIIIIVTLRLSWKKVLLIKACIIPSLLCVINDYYGF